MVHAASPHPPCDAATPGPVAPAGRVTMANNADLGDKPVEALMAEDLAEQAGCRPAPPREWIFLSTDPKDPRFRLRLEDGRKHGLIRLLEEEMSSRAPTAQVTEANVQFILTSEQACWVYAAFGEMLSGGGETGTEAHLQPMKLDRRSRQSLLDFAEDHQQVIPLVVLLQR